MTREFYIPDIYRSLTVGFDDALKQLESVSKNTMKGFSYPPYNIIKVDENKYLIEIAVAGFSKQDIEIELKDGTLVVNGKLNTENSENTYLYKGIADRAFMRKFSIADTVEIKNAHLLNGMLKIFLENIIPESKKPLKIEIKDTANDTNNELG